MSRLIGTVSLGLLLAPGLFGAVPVPAAKRIPLPLVFAPGGGPAGSPAEFVGRNSRYTLRLSSAGLDVLPTGAAAPLRIRLEGANRQPALEGVDRQPGHSFYYFGSDPKRWRTNVPNFAPFTALPNNVDLAEGTTSASLGSPAERYWGKRVRKMDFSRPDLIDEDAFNRYIWSTIKGDAPYPSEFVGAHGKGLRRLGLRLEPMPEDD